MSELLPARGPDQAIIRRPRLTPAAVAVTYAVGYVLWARFGGGSERMRALASETVFLPLNALVVVLFLLAARREETRAPMRRALRLLATASAAVICGNLVALRAVSTDTHLPAGSLADLCFIAYYPLTLAAYLSIPVGRRRMHRLKFLCDAGMVLAGGGLALWYFVLRPIAANAPAEQVALGLLYPLADLLLLVGVVTIVLRRPLDDHHGAIAWLGASTALSVVADLAFNLVMIDSGNRALLGTDVLYLATYTTLAVSADRFRRFPATPGAASDHPRLSRIGSRLPFVTAGATYLLLCTIALRSWVAPLSGVALGAVAVSLFLGARLMLAFRQGAARAAEAAVRGSEARFRSLVQHSSDLIFVLGADGIIQFASSSATRLIGYEPDALVGVELSALAHPHDAAIVSSFVALVSRHKGVSGAVEWRLRGADDSVVQVEAIASNQLDDESVRGIVVNARDVGERKALLDQLEHQAFHDSLTGLANRALFYDRVRHALDLAHRQGRTVTLLFLDLDDFKAVNDSMGHAEGDRLLRMVADRLRACARVTETVARLGGDEFAILVEDVTDVQSADRLAERIREQMSFPFALGEGDVRISASIGSASAVGGDVDEVLRHADLAMYAAKRSEKGGHRRYNGLTV